MSNSPYFICIHGAYIFPTATLYSSIALHLIQSQFKKLKPDPKMTI